jgi:hypothetical protein
VGLSNRQAAVGSALALAVVALVVDRFVLSSDPGPASAAAAVSGESSVVPTSTPPAPKTRSDETSLARRLRDVARELEGAPAANNAADIFATPAMWRKPAQASVATGVPAEKPEVDLPALKLSSVMGATHAVINGRAMAVGESMDVQATGKQVVRVELVRVDGMTRQAVVRVLGREIVLNLTTPGKNELGRMPGT